MLDLDLVQGRPALQFEFRVSLAEDLLHVLSLVMDAPWIEGVDQWIYATHAALPASLKSDMEIVLILIQKSHALHLWMRQLPLDAPPHRDFAAFTSWLSGFSEDDFGALIGSSLEKLSAACCEDEELEKYLPLSLENPGGLKAVLRQKLNREQVGRALHLLHNPIELKAQFISVITRFWEQFYQQEYLACLPIMERSIAYHRQQTYSADFESTFIAVTGRRLTKDRGSYDDVERIIFFPSCHIGPYVIIHDDPALRPVVSLHFNCRPTGAPEREPERDRVPAVQDLFPPLKALSDETRLQILTLLEGRELYAQEIVDLLDISQSAVSRHLKLMLSGGLLIVRRENSMKYYSINEETLAALADRLKSFRGKKNE
jgi:DNA-binding transcriptional ArsR family regulator